MDAGSRMATRSAAVIQGPRATLGASRARIAREPLSHLLELVQRAQIVRPRLLEGLRPVRPRHLADVEVAAAVDRKPMRRQEFGRAEAGPEPAYREMRLPVLSTIGTRGPRFGTWRVTGC